MTNLVALFGQAGYMLREAMAAMLCTPEEVLVHPGDAGSERVVVSGIPYGYTSEFKDLLTGVRLEGRRSGIPAEAFAERVLAGFFRLYGVARAEMRGLAAAKASTRQELYRRLVVARAYMEEHVGLPLTVDQVARVALLNRYYFIELFKAAFGVTPHQYLRRKKLEYAYGLLRSGDSVTKVCYLTGFQSPGSFTHLFKKTFGCLPSAVNGGADSMID